MMNFSRSLLFLSVTLFVACGGEPPRSWSSSFNNIGTYSSARVADLTGDGVLDVVMGAGGQEEKYSDTAVVAVDGATGALLWRIPGANQYVGSAVFNDITSDGVPDVFIGGRWAQLAAINGATGKIIWSFFAERTEPVARGSGWYNFTTPQFVPDQDGDGTADLLIANGGNPEAAPYDTVRPSGRLLVLGARTGKILADVSMPDRKEIYMSVVCQPRAGGGLNVFFGTGGETIGGHLYRTTLADIMRGNISGATVLATSNTKGFISSPVLTDITNDGTHDIVINAVDGLMMAIDGATDSLLWQVHLPGTEAYTIPAVGLFTGDATPDFFANFAIGSFPRLNYSVRFLVDGKSGAVAFRDTIPSFQYASPVAADLDGDGWDEAIMNQSALQRRQFENSYFSYLTVFDFKKGNFYSIGDTLKATNLASTPWIGDLDGDKKLDILYTAVNYYDTRFDLQKPLGLIISRYRMDIDLPKRPFWGAYMGSNYGCVFP
jgi:outer membrane protein assembly factor BamB